MHSSHVRPVVTTLESTDKEISTDSRSFAEEYYYRKIFEIIMYKKTESLLHFHIPTKPSSLRNEEICI